MARYVKDFPTTKSPEEIMKIANDFFYKEGFNRVNFKGEDVWKKGIGFTSPQFIKLQLAPGMIHMEAWLKFAWFPGVYSGEMGLTGATAFAIKKMLASRVNTLEALLK